MKIEIYGKQKSILKQLKSILSYISFGGKDKQILDLKLELEDALYLKYVMINKVILYSIVGLALVSFLLNLSFGKSFFTIYTTPVLIWFLLNYVFWKKIKQLYLKVIRRYLLRTSRHLYAS